MSDAEWDADDFDLDKKAATVIAKPATDKWEGEDEEDDVKDSWDADDAADGAAADPNAPKAVQRKKKKKIGDIILEKEAAAEAEQEARRREVVAAKAMNTPEGKLAEKLRLQKLEENANLQLAKDMLGLKKADSVDNIVPVSKEEFDQFEKALVDKIGLFSNSEHFPDFLENFIRNLCLDVSPATLKKIKMNIEALHSTKLKEEKEKSSKAKKKGKGGSLKMDTNKDIFSGSAGNDFDELDDFM